METVKTHKMNVKVSRIEFSVLPHDHELRRHYVVTIEWRGGDRWAVVHGRHVFGSHGEWEFEPLNSYRTDEWKQKFRFDFKTATRIAGEQARLIKVNGKTAHDILAAEE